MSTYPYRCDGGARGEWAHGGALRVPLSTRSGCTVGFWTGRQVRHLKFASTYVTNSASDVGGYPAADVERHSPAEQERTMNDTYSCPECGGDRDALLTPMPPNPPAARTQPRPGKPCTCTQNSRTSGAFGEVLTPPEIPRRD
jgi:hypothetical protein